MANKDFRDDYFILQIPKPSNFEYEIRTQRKYG